MAILNDPASLPSPHVGPGAVSPVNWRQYPAERARALLSPPSLLPDERRAKDETFNWAVRTLRISAWSWQMTIVSAWRHPRRNWRSAISRALRPPSPGGSEPGP